MAKEKKLDEKQLLEKAQELATSKAQRAVKSVLETEMKSYMEQIIEQVLKSIKNELIPIEKRVREGEAQIMNVTMVCEYIIDILQKQKFIGDDKDLKTGIQKKIQEYVSKMKANMKATKEEENLNDRNESNAGKGDN